jgi:hypothetical protein
MSRVHLEDGSDFRIMALVQTPLWKRAEYLHKVAHSLKENSQVRHVVCSTQLCTIAMVDKVQTLLVIAPSQTPYISLMQPIADTLVKEVAKPAKDSVTEVVRSGDFLSYTAGAQAGRLSAVLRLESFRA